jgi:hypothetical protein
MQLQAVAVQTAEIIHVMPGPDGRIMPQDTKTPPPPGVGHNSAGAKDIDEVLDDFDAWSKLSVFSQFEAIVDCQDYTAEQKCILVKIRCRVDRGSMGGAIDSNDGLMRAASLKDRRAFRAELRDLQGKARELPEGRDAHGRPISDPVDKSRSTIVIEERRGKASVIGFTPERLLAIASAYLQHKEEKRGPGRPWPSKPPASHAPPLSAKPPAPDTGGLDKPPAFDAINPLRPTHPDPILSKTDNTGADAPLAGEPSPPAKAKRAKPRTQIPADWRPTPDLVVWVKSGWDATDAQIEREAKKFVSSHQAKGNLMASWPAAWRTWWENDYHRIPRRAVDQPASLLDPETELQQLAASDTGKSWIAKLGREKGMEKLREQVANARKARGV